MILESPSYVILPMDIHDNPWYNNSTLQILKVIDLLLWPKHFVVALILKINALIGILISLAVSIATLVSKIKTTNFINNLNKNISLALTKQQIINKNPKTNKYT